MLIDVFRLRIPDMFLVDAVVGMEGNGPACPDVRDIGLILASDNAVALDSVMARMMGLDPALLRFLQKAKEEGLGDYDLNSIEIIGELKQIPDFKLPLLGGEAIIHNKPVQDLIHSRTLVRPKANPDWCTGCGTCVDQCPVSALSMCGQVPEVDPESCITCFCCQEICPEKAMSLE
jgi:ferredoxin